MSKYTQASQLERGKAHPAIDAAAATGTGSSQVFAVSNPQNGSVTAGYQHISDGSMTAFTADLEVSADYGVTFTKVGSTLDLVTTAAGTLTLIPGLLYRLNIKTWTKNAATKSSVYVSC